MYGAPLTVKKPNKKKPAAQPAAKSETPDVPPNATLSKVVLVASGMLLMFLLESLFWPGHGLAWKQAKAKRVTTVAHASTTNFPWGGQLEYVPIALDRPEEYFTNDPSFRPTAIWTFRNQTEAQLVSLFSTLDFTPDTHAWLSDRAHWETSPGVVRIKPTPEIILSLSSDTRARFYSMLARDPENVFQIQPFRFRADGFDDWFAECGLSKEKVSLVRKLTYREGVNLCFADAATFAQISSPDETRCLVKSLWRVSTFVMRLRIDPDTDVGTVMRYWGMLGPAYVYKPLVESMSRVNDGSGLNVSYFLPPFARLRLYTYPNPRDPNIVRQDCFWSSMNFFNTTPDNGFFNPDYTRKVLHDDYTRNPAGPHEFGDLLMLASKDGQALHMCVYLADDVVFTKNGANTQQPWVLMRLPEMLANYEADKPFQVLTYRRKSPPLSSSLEFPAMARAR